MLDEVFHITEDGVECIAGAMPGATKKEQTVNCYILTGLRAFIQNDSADFSDADAVSLCKQMGCYDRNNHTANRRSTGNRMSGERKSGFSLPAPGLRAAAELVRQIVQGTSQSA